VELYVLPCQVIETVSKILWFGKNRGRREVLAMTAARGNFVSTVAMLNIAVPSEETRCL
jgi:hypothetical protein